MNTNENQKSTFTSEILICAIAITTKASTESTNSILVSNVIMAASVHKRRQRSFVAPVRAWTGLCLSM